MHVTSRIVLNSLSQSLRTTSFAWFRTKVTRLRTSMQRLIEHALGRRRVAAPQQLPHQHPVLQLICFDIRRAVYDGILIAIGRNDALYAEASYNKRGEARAGAQIDGDHATAERVAHG